MERNPAFPEKKIKQRGWLEGTGTRSPFDVWLLAFSGLSAITAFAALFLERSVFGCASRLGSPHLLDLERFLFSFSFPISKFLYQIEQHWN
jgi:hypothetical protein